MSNLNGRVSRLEDVMARPVGALSLPPVAWYNEAGELVTVWTFQPSGHLYEYRYKDGDSWSGATRPHRYTESPQWIVCHLEEVHPVEGDHVLYYATGCCYRRGRPDQQNTSYLGDGEGLFCGPVRDDWRDPMFTIDPDQWLIECPPGPPLGGRVLVYLDSSGQFDRRVIFEARKPVFADVVDTGGIFV